MAKELQIIKENNNIAEWSRQVEECRNSGLSVRSWCEQHQIAVSTFHYRRQSVLSEHRFWNGTNPARKCLPENAMLGRHKPYARVNGNLYNNDMNRALF